MGYLRDTVYYKDVINVLQYPYATYYMFDTFMIAEIEEGIVYTWDDHAKPIVEELSKLYGENGENLVMISNRVNSYSVKPSDWIKFFKSDYKLKGYGIISYSRKGLIISMIEKLFMRNLFQTFDNLDSAIAWAKELTNASDIPNGNGKSA